MHIAIEGMDGVGKTTVAHRLAQRLGFRVVEKPLQHLFEGAGGLDTYLRCRDWVNEQTDNDPLRAWFYGLGNLYLLDRFRGEDIITDRHLVSNYYWCGAESTEGLFRCLVDLAGAPDLTVLLYATPEVGAQRLRNRAPHDSDLPKTELYVASVAKMESFLRKFGMTHLSIDTSDLTPQQVVDLVVAALPVRRELASDGETPL